MGEKYNLLKINRYQHQYVIGIDFGHGETSAAYAEIDWDKSAGKSERQIFDIRINPGATFDEKILVSAICEKPDGSCFVGDMALDENNLADGSNLRIGFKQPPSNINGQKERLMIRFMNLVYMRIREELHDKLNDHNHVVYIARPSGWKDEQVKKLYIQMAQKAQIPLAGLTSESRAAIFYAYNHIRIGDGFNKAFKRGGVVFDLGSSTLDFTYISDDKIEEHGYLIGASYIDRAIYEQCLLKTEVAKEFIQRYPQFKDKILFEARKAKEMAFYQSKIDKSIELSSIMPDNHFDKESYENIYVKVKFINEEELNDFCNKQVLVDPFESGNTIGYLDSLKTAMNDFKENYIPAYPINGVFYTGGASRMKFIKPLIQECFKLGEDAVLSDQINPSLTVSKGIASLGVADARCELLIEQLNKKVAEKTSLSEIKKMIVPYPLEALVGLNVPLNDTNTLIGMLVERVSTSAWTVVDTACRRFVWINPKVSLDMKDLETYIRVEMSNYENNNLQSIVYSVFNQFIKNKTEIIQNDLNEVILLYGFDKKLEIGVANNLRETSAIKKEVDKMTQNIAEICAKNTTKLISQILWAALGLFLFGIFAAIYYAIKGIVNAFTSEKTKREKLIKKILDKKEDIILDIKLQLARELSGNSYFISEVSTQMKEYFDKTIKSNINRVRIPLE